MNAKADAQRLFIALWPDAALRDALRAEQAAWQWPKGVALTPPDKLHLTLHFIGEASADSASALAAVLPPRFEPIALVLDRRDSWPNGCAVLGPGDVPPALRSLHDALGRTLRGLGLALEARPWRAHVTLARHARGARPPTDAPAPLQWRIDRAVLVRSHAGRYTVLAPPIGAQ